MGGRCRWQTIGRNDYQEPKAMSKEEISSISSLAITHVEGSHHLKDVLKDGIFIGRVRHTVHGDQYKFPNDKSFIRTVGDFNQNDPEYGRALLALIN